MIFEDDELAELQAEVKEIMDEVAPDLFDSFRGSTRTRDETSPEQYVTTPTQILTDYPCWFRLTNNSDRFLAGLQSGIGLFTVIVPGGIDLAVNDLLTIKAKGNEATKELVVNTILKSSNSLKWKVICAEN